MILRNITTDLFKLRNPSEPPRIGSLLVANPFLTEKWFDRAVILIVDHGTERGTIGTVLNLALDTFVNEIVEDMDVREGVRVFCGGPVGQDRMYFVHTLGPDVIPGAQMIADGLWLGGDFEAAAAYVNSGYPVEGFIRFFVGYSGWAEGQLEEENDSATWAVTKIPVPAPQLIEGAGERYWHNIVRNLGPEYRSWLMLPHDSHKN